MTNPRDSISVYFKDRSTIDDLKQLATDCNTSFSAIVDAVLAAALPQLKEKAPKNRTVKLNMTIKI